MQRLSNQITLLALFLCHSFCMAQKQGSIRLYGSIVSETVAVSSIDDNGLTYINDRTKHMINGQNIAYVRIGDSIFGYNLGQELKLMNLNNIDIDDPEYKYKKLMKKRSIPDVLLIGTGQVAMTGAAFFPSLGTGAVGGLITTAFINYFSNRQVDYGRGAAAGAMVGYSVGTAVGISLVGAISYGTGNIKGTAVGASIGASSGLWLWKQSSRVPESQKGTYIISGLLAPLVGSMVGYYTELHVSKAKKTRAILELKGDRLSLGLTF